MDSKSVNDEKTSLEKFSKVIPVKFSIFERQRLKNRQILIGKFYHRLRVYQREVLIRKFYDLSTVQEFTKKKKERLIAIFENLSNYLY